MKPNTSELLAGIALIILGALAGALVFFPIPGPNATSLTFILGALAGALNVAGGHKVSGAITQTPTSTTVKSG